MDVRGMTLIELLVVMTAVAIIVIGAGYEFSGWQSRYKVEAQVKEMYGDLMDMRLRAMQKSRMYFIHLDSAFDTQYSIYKDDGDGISNIATDTIVNDLSRTGLEYPVRFNGGVTPMDIEADSRGIISLNRSIWLVRPDGTTFGADEADYDCVVVSLTRINMGKYDGAKIPPCVAK